MLWRVRFLRWVAAAAMVNALDTGRFPLAAQRTDSLPRPPGVRIVPLPRDSSDRPAETAVAVNPRDPQHVMVAYQQYYDVHPPFAAAGVRRLDVRVAWSADGGESWTIAPGTAPPNYLVSGDPSVTFDLHGHAFLAYIAFDQTGQLWYWSKGASRNGIFVRRSLDGGRTWEVAHTPLVERAVLPDPPFQDKGYILADNNASSPHVGNLYVGWTNYTLDKSEILFSRSTDDGKTWSPPMVISGAPGLPRGSASGAVVGFHATVGRDGTVYAIWPDGQAIVLAVSRDGGRSFEPSRRAFQTTLWALFSTVTDFPGANGLPSIAIDPRASPGRLFVTWGDYRYGDLDILMATSDDGGRTWAQPVRVNDDAKHNGKDQVFSWVAVDPTDGAAYVLFYDRRGDPKNVLPAVTLARSTDGGRTFTNYAWSAAPSDPKQASYGDYIGLAARDGRVYGAWPENAPRPQAATTATTADNRSVGTAMIRIGTADFRSRPRATGGDPRSPDRADGAPQTRGKQSDASNH